VGPDGIVPGAPRSPRDSGQSGSTTPRSTYRTPQRRRALRPPGVHVDRNPTRDQSGRLGVQLEVRGPGRGSVAAQLIQLRRSPWGFRVGVGDLMARSLYWSRYRGAAPDARLVIFPGHSSPSSLLLAAWHENQPGSVRLPEGRERAWLWAGCPRVIRGEKWFVLWLGASTPT